MIKAMRTAASGMVAQQMNVDNIANNLANVNTTGFKRSKLEFQDVLYQNFRRAGTASSIGTEVPVGLDIGYGTRPSATVREFSTGDLSLTTNPLDIAIEGDGFFQVQMLDGGTGYTRDGAFKLSAEGRLVTSDGYYVLPHITIPDDTLSVSVGQDGVIQVQQFGQDEPTEIGQFELARFVNPAGLAPLGRNLFSPTAASGNAVVENPGINGMGTLNQYFLEISNVSVVDEMVNMIIAQRAYEVNSKAIQTSDDMLQTANQIIR